MNPPSENALRAAAAASRPLVVEPAGGAASSGKAVQLAAPAPSHRRQRSGDLRRGHRRSASGSGHQMSSIRLAQLNPAHSRWAAITLEKAVEKCTLYATQRADDIDFLLIGHRVHTSSQRLLELFAARFFGPVYVDEGAADYPYAEVQMAVTRLLRRWMGLLPVDFVVNSALQQAIHQFLQLASADQRQKKADGAHSDRVVRALARCQQELRVLRTMDASAFSSLDHPIGVVSVAAQRAAGKLVFANLETDVLAHQLTLLEYQHLRKVPLRELLDCQQLDSDFALGPTLVAPKPHNCAQQAAA